MILFTRSSPQKISQINNIILFTSSSSQKIHRSIIYFCLLVGRLKKAPGILPAVDF
jgi:hypothetical protein